jgi:hypothetical protein
MAELLASLLPDAPKRSRSNVERASTALMAAGLMEHAVEVRSHAPPALDGVRDLIRITPQDAPTISPPAPPPTPVEPSADVPPSRRFGFVIAGAAVGLAIAAGLAYGFARSSTVSPAPELRVESSAPDPESHPFAPPTGVSTPIAPIAVETTVVPPIANSSAPIALPTRRVPPPVGASASASAAPSASAATTATIPPPKSDEPDLGY